MTRSVEAILQEDLISKQIVLFLLENEAAMDTVKGIARWWVRRDELAVQAALDRLISCGIMTPHTFASGILYSLTKNQEMRDWLRNTCGIDLKPNVESPSDGKRLAPANH